jgi:signal transduction histidine kinase
MSDIIWAVRRDVYLIFKEAINNAARHSRCTTVMVRFRASRHERRLEVEDDGIGFDVTAGSDGMGVASMRRPAERLAATLEIVSRPGGGTRLTLMMAGSSSPSAVSVDVPAAVYLEPHVAQQHGNRRAGPRRGDRSLDCLRGWRSRRR